MAPRWKAFAIWLVFPFLCYEVVEPGILWLFSHDVSLAPMYRLKSFSIALAICVSLAAFGTTAVWMLPIRRPWVGIASGMILAAAGVAVWAWLAMTFYGGFEENIGIAIGALSLMIPSCLAGAYVGFLRARAQREPMK